MDPQEELISRLRTALADEPTIREVSMFGGRSFMINNKMMVSALKRGDLLVRVAADQHARLLEQPGASQAEMGKERSMGPGWIEVAADSIADDQGLSSWLRIAMDYNRELTG